MEKSSKNVAVHIHHSKDWERWHAWGRWLFTALIIVIAILIIAYTNRQIFVIIKLLINKIMSKIQELSAKVDELQLSLDAEQAQFAQVIADLEAVVAVLQAQVDLAVINMRQLQLL
jgi:outer membrane murein-binding lipoprotein Lpp